MLGAKVRTYCEESNTKGERVDVLVFLDVLGLLEFLVFLAFLELLASNV